MKPEDIAMFQYTGGTTGVSKGVVATHRNVVANYLPDQGLGHRNRNGPKAKTW